MILSFNNWKKYWQQRFNNPLTDLETFKTDKNNKLLEIGNRTSSYDNIKGQYMGVFKIDPYSWKRIKQYLFKNIKNLDKIDITGLFQLILKKKNMQHIC